MLSGKVAVITGAGQGIGRSEALALAEAGAHVVVNDVGTAEDGSGRGAADIVVDEIKALGGSAEANSGDVADWEAGRALIAQAETYHGAVDILICNAGIIRDRTLTRMSIDEWDAVLRVHLRGHFIPLHFAASTWRESFRSTGTPVDARVVTTSSESGLFGGFGQANYAAAKAGIVALSQVAARELDEAGVRINVICPRARTPMTEGVVPGMTPAPGEFDEWDPAAIATWVTFLAGPRAREISGQVFVVHGQTIKRMQPWAPRFTVRGDGPWTQDTLAAEIGRLGERPMRLEAFEDLLGAGEG